jgi:Uma2 family endonuclease
MAVQTAQPQTETLLTGEELLAMGDIGPCELIEGRLVKMSPTGDPHGGYESNFDEYLKAFIRKHRLGKLRVGEVGIYIRRNPDTVRAADVIFISNERYAKRQRKEGYLEVAPELVVEIMSPDDRWIDVTAKLRDYFSIGVKLVWVADPADRTVYAYRSMTEVRAFSSADTLTSDDILPGFSVPVAALFEE